MGCSKRDAQKHGQATVYLGIDDKHDWEVVMLDGCKVVGWKVSRDHLDVLIH